MLTGPAALRMAGIAIAAALVLAGCMNPLGSVLAALRVQDAEAASGPVADVRISVGGYGAQSIIPDVASRIDEYHVTLSRDGFDDISLSGAGTTFDFTEVPAGTWTVIVEAVDAGGAVIGRGSAQIDVAVGGANSVSVSVAPTDAGTGTVDLTVSWDPPSLIDAVQSATLTPQDEGGAAQDISGDLDVSAVASGQIAYQASLDAGVYRLELRFGREGRFVAVVMEALHVYDNVVTEETLALSSAEIGMAPEPPTDVSATTAVNQVALSWSDVSTVNELYEIQRKLGSESTWQTIDIDPPLGATAVGYVDTAALGGTTYDYRIRATNQFGPANASEGWVEITGVTSNALLFVTTSQPTGPGSLQAALSGAQSGDTILFDKDRTISAPATLAAPPSWFTISESVTIDAGSHTIVLDANDAGRHFHVQGPATLTLKSDPDAGGSLELRNGRGQDGSEGVRGGAVFVDSGASLVTEYVDFLHNETTAGQGDDSSGGAISALGDVSITGGTFKNNSGGSYGGAIAVAASAGSFIVKGATFDGNSASSDGGAIRTFAEDAIISGTTFVRNSASGAGGALRSGSTASRTRITTSRFYGNSTGSHGGAIAGIWLSEFPRPQLVVSTSVFVGNLVPNGLIYNGSAIRFDGVDAAIVNSTFHRNGIDTSYRLFSSGSGSYNFKNNIFRDTDTGLATLVEQDGNTHSLEEPYIVRKPQKGTDGVWGTADDDYGDLRLQSNSPAVDRGGDTHLRWDFADLDGDGDTTEPESRDLDGNPRVINGTVDHGAYEFTGESEPGILRVTKSAATGGGSLTQALSQAADGDTIIFDGSYTITAPDPLPAAPNWFTVSDSITIDAQNNDIVLDANQLGRHFLVDGSATLTLRSDGGGSFTLQNGLGIDDGDPLVVAGHGGAIFVSNNSNLDMAGVTFTGNATQSGSGRSGGALRLGTGTHVVRDSVFDGNDTDSLGGAIFQVAAGTLRVQGSQLRNNRAGLGSGGGGGAIFVQGGTASTITVADSLFEGNEAQNTGRGGAIYLDGVGRIHTTRFFRNTSADEGGAIYGNDGSADVSIAASSFAGNLSATGGGAIFAAAGDLTVASSEFYGNSSTGGAAGAIRTTTGAHVVSSSTFVANSQSSGEEVVMDAGEISNSVFAGDDVPGGSPTVTYTIAGAGAVAGTGNLNADPLLVAAPAVGGDGLWGTGDDTGDLSLQSGSPAIDAGNATLLPADATDLDGDGDTTETLPRDRAGNPRVSGSALDMGAYEAQ